MVGAGICFASFAVFYSIVSGRWYRRLIWIINEVRPEPMNLSIEIDKGSDSTNYYAILTVAETETAERQLWKNKFA